MEAPLMVVITLHYVVVKSQHQLEDKYNGGMLMTRRSTLTFQNHKLVLPPPKLTSCFIVVE
jgi:hypothetical protein